MDHVWILQHLTYPGTEDYTTKSGEEMSPQEGTYGPCFGTNWIYQEAGSHKGNSEGCPLEADSRMRGFLLSAPRVLPSV